jgi:HTH-type transcriptional regulator/antitoxin HigA
LNKPYFDNETTLKMTWKVIKTEAQYKKALHRAMEIFHANENTSEGDEVALLLVLIRDYEDHHITIPYMEI